MRFEPYEKIFKLTGEAIDTWSEDMEQALTALDVERQNRLRIRLSLEECLLRMRDRFGEDAEVKASLYKSFGRPTLKIEHEGDIYNPLGKTLEELEDWTGSLLTTVGLSPQYSYSGGRNTLKLILPGQHMNPATKIVIAIAVGVLAGLAGNAVLGDPVREAVSQSILEPCYDVWFRILMLISGPVIFLMVLATLLNMGAISEQGGDNRRTIARYFFFSFVIAVVAEVVAAPVFRPEYTGMDPDSAKGLLWSIFDIVPQEVFSPFEAANTPQLLLLAFVLGNALIIIGSRAQGLANIARQANIVGSLITEWVSRLVPYFAALLICLEIWEKRTNLLRGIWLPFLLSVAVAMVAVQLVITYTARRKGMPTRKLCKKIKEPFLLTLRAGNLDTGFGQLERCCAVDLGMERHFVTISLPHGLVLYMPGNVIGTLIFTIYAAAKFDVSVGFSWYCAAMILAVVLFVATPPVPGANLLAYIVIFAQLGIPAVALIDAMIFDIVFGILATAVNQVLLQMELIFQADRLGLLDRARLQR